MEVGEAALVHLSRGWAWEVEEGVLHHQVAAEAAAAVVEGGELELLQLGVVERAPPRELVVVAEGMGELVVAELRSMGELVVVVVCWRQVVEGVVEDHCLSMAVVVLAERRMAGEAAASLVHCWVSWGVTEAAKLHLECLELGEVEARQNALA